MFVHEVADGAAPRNIITSTEITMAIAITRDLLGETDGGNHRIEREHDVDNGDLDQQPRRMMSRPDVGAFSSAPSRLVWDFRGAFHQQKQTTEDQDQVASGDALAQHAE